PIGQTRSYAAQAVYSPSATCTADSTELNFDVSQSATFTATTTSGTNPVATLAGNVAKGQNAGTAEITASYKGQSSNTLSLKVVAVSLKSLSVSGPASTYLSGTVTMT